METISREALEHAQAIFCADKQDIRTGNDAGLNIEAYLNHYGREIVKIKPHGTSTLYCLKECVFDPAHTTNEAHIGINAEGVLFYKCFHNSCQGRTWRQAREIISGQDSLLSYCPTIYIEDRKDRKTIKDYQGFTEGGIQAPLDRDKLSFDPLSILKKVQTSWLWTFMLNGLLTN